MKRVVYIITVMLSVFILSACNSGMVVYDAQPNERVLNGDTWTVMVYMCGGKEESESGVYSDKLREMMKVNYPESVKVIVQTGGSEQWHLNGVYSDYSQRFEVRKDKLYLADQSAPVDMGNYRTLENFISWGKANYKADHYMLILSGEGGGSMYGMCYDELNDGGGLSLEEISYAMSLDGSGLDIVGLDTSLMGSIETGTSLSTYAQYMVASQDIQPSDGWDYEGFLKYLCANPSADAAEVGMMMCNTYYNKCVKNGTEADAAMSLTDMTKLSTLNQAFDGMAGDMLMLTDTIENFAVLSNTLDSIHIYGGASEDEGFSNLIDIGDTAMKMKQYVGNTADVLIDALNDAVVYRVCGSREQNSAGLSVYYPLNKNNDELQEYMKMATGVKYKELLRKICVNCNVTDDAMTSDYTASGAWQAYNADMQTLEYMSILNGNSYELNIAGNMNMFKDVAINVYKADKNGGYVFIGSYGRLNENWDMGIFQDNFDGKMFRLYSKNITPTLIRRYEEYDLYSVPAIINGERRSVRVAYYSDKDKYKVLGSWPYIDGGKVTGHIEKIGFFDNVLPMLRVYDETHQVTEYIVDGSVTRLLRSTGEDGVDSGSYIFEYEMTDIYGQKRRGTPVNAGVTGGKVTFR